MFYIIMNESVTISISVLLQMFKNQFQCVLKLSNVKSKRSHFTDVATIWIITVIPA